jgi:serine/threonine protein kinase
MNEETAPHQPPAAAADETALNELQSLWERAWAQGRDVSAAELCRDRPELTPQLEWRIQPVRQLNRLAQPQTLPTTVTTPGVLDATAEPSQALPSLPGYEVLGELGRGGMGVVYKARQQGTDQIVALKMLHPFRIDGLHGVDKQDVIDQFRLEVKAAARLRHPNRVRILHLGEHDGHPFYVMELIEGCSLADRVKQAPGVSKEATVKYLASVAEAVHEAHQHGILHRDLKPRNILIDERTDEALLTDFGLAQMERGSPAGETFEKPGVRQQARLAGTLPYMSPEQTWDPDRVTEASDVYSLGATLYELLTGRPPFTGQSRTELLERIRKENPAPPRQHRRDVNRRIEAICLKCLHKDPAHRYPTALQFAQALRHYLQEVRYARNFTSMGTLFLGLGPVVFLLNFAVYLLLHTHFYEPVIWVVMFSPSLALFSVFLLAPPKEAGLEPSYSRVEMWSIWGSKFFAALSISIALRWRTSCEPQRAMLLFYPAYAALSGMAAFSQVSKMTWKPKLLAAAWGPAAVAMVFQLEWAPVIYGLYSLVGSVLFGVYLRKLGKELR